MKITFATAPTIVRARYPKATVEHVTRNGGASYYLVYAREQTCHAGEMYIGTGSSKGAAWKDAALSILKAENDR